MHDLSIAMLKSAKGSLLRLCKLFTTATGLRILRQRGALFDQFILSKMKLSLLPLSPRPINSFGSLLLVLKQRFKAITAGEWDPFLNHSSILG
jgi:hypothetical protein